MTTGILLTDDQMLARVNAGIDRAFWSL